MSKYKITQRAYNFTWSYIWPLVFSWWSSPLYYIFDIHLGCKFDDEHKPNNKLVLETGVGRYPWHLLYKKGNFVGTDYLKKVVKTNRMLTRLIKKIKKSNDGEDSEFIVCDNRYLPFSDKAFDAVVSVAGYAHRKEIKRVLREEGTEILIGAELI